ncbi:MAG: hypothetical protein LBM64_02620 [Deltaproteobacteria bacterium]|nr:hypothetical protein [Deltaproteobacteria bacterium]
MHGIQAVLLFDNDSDAYSGQELLQHLAAKTSLDLLCLVQLPYPFGPGGGPGRPRLVEANEGRPLPWDSDFLNYGIPAMAYLRFLEQAAQVIVCDIDEIILAEDQGDLAAKLQASPAGILNVPGVWATALATPGARGKTLNGKSGASVFFQAPFQDDPMVAKKYAFAQRGVQRLDQLNVHNIWKASGEPMPADETSLLYRHFKQVSTDWKGESRLIKPPFDKTRHIFDCAFVKAMSRAVRKVRGYAYPLQEILAYARSIGACPRPEGSRPAPPYRDYDCSLCPYKA